MYGARSNLDQVQHSVRGLIRLDPPGRRSARARQASLHTPTSPYLLSLFSFLPRQHPLTQLRQLALSPLAHTPSTPTQLLSLLCCNLTSRSNGDLPEPFPTGVLQRDALEDRVELVRPRTRQPDSSSLCAYSLHHSPCLCVSSRKEGGGDAQTLRSEGLRGEVSPSNQTTADSPSSPPFHRPWSQQERLADSPPFLYPLLCPCSCLVLSSRSRLDPISPRPFARGRHLPPSPTVPPDGPNQPLRLLMTLR